MPAKQELHSDAPARLKPPDPHRAHDADDVIPVPVPYDPAAQNVQDAALLASASDPYVPATHDRHWLNEVIPQPVSYVPPAHAVQLLSPDPLA